MIWQKKLLLNVTKHKYSKAMVRYFDLNLNRKVSVGVIAQSPMGDGCTVEFTDFTITKNDCKDMRKGE